MADVFPGEDQPDLSLTSAVLDRMTRACTQRPSRARVADVVAATWPAEWPADAEPCDRHRMAMAGLDVALAKLEPADRMPHRVALFAAAVIRDAMAAGVYPEPEAPKPHVPSWQREQAQKREQATAALYALLKADA